MRAKHLVYINLELVVPPISLKKKGKGERVCVHICHKERDTHIQRTCILHLRLKVQPADPLY